MTLQKHEAVMAVLLNTGEALEGAVKFAQDKQVFVEGLPETLESFSHALESLAKRISHLKSVESGMVH